MIGKKDDWGKLKWRLLPWKEIESVVRVLTDGADHYGCENWKDVSTPHERYSDALGRHVSEYLMGNKIDKKSGLPTLAHVVCNALFLMWFDNKKEVTNAHSTHSSDATPRYTYASGVFLSPEGMVTKSFGIDKAKTCGDDCPICRTIKNDC